MHLMAKETKKEKKARLAAARRNRFKGVNVPVVLESYAQSAVWTEALFNVNPVEFLTGRIPENKTVYNPGSDGGSVITLPELAGFRRSGFSGQIGGNFGTYADNAVDAMARNLSGGAADYDTMTAIRGMVMPAVTSAGIGIGFNIGKKMTRKPRAAANRLIKRFELDKWIKF